MIPVISIVGKSNSGKTTLIERLIPEFKKRGYRIGTIKHDAHKFEIDHKGKDSWRMTAAGADTVVIASKEKMGVVKKLECENDIDEIVMGLLADVDIVIAEGYKKYNKPKIEVIRSGDMVSGKDSNLVAVVDNTGVDSTFHLPEEISETTCFKMNNIEEIADRIEESVIAGRELEVINCK